MPTIIKSTLNGSIKGGSISVLSNTFIHKVVKKENRKTTKSYEYPEGSWNAYEDEPTGEFTICDEVWLYAYNNNDESVRLTLDLKDTFFDKDISKWYKAINFFLKKKIESKKDEVITFLLLPKRGLVPIFPGVIIPIDASIYAYVSNVNTPILITGFVNSIFEKETI